MHPKGGSKKGLPRAALDPESKSGKIRQMLREGKTPKEIMQTLGVSYARIRNQRQQYRPEIYTMNSDNEDRGE